MSAPWRVSVLAIATAALLGVLAPLAYGSSAQLSVFEDDHLLLYSGDAVRERTLDEIKSLGADSIHVLVMWDRLEPAPHTFGDWRPWDALVAGAQARGLQVLFSPTGRAPAWASECKGNTDYRQRCSPSVAAFSEFVQAVGARYPGVTQWSFWNEPNHASWLVPQTGKRNGIRVNLAAIRYRELVQAGISALATTGHANDLILLGETAPLGSGHSTAPVDFYRELFCLDRSYRPFRGTAAKVRGCSPRPRLRISGVSHHPYTFGGVAKPSVTGKRNDAPIGALGRITRVLDKAAHYGVVRSHLPLYLTEFGYQTRPPDPFGVSLAEQARYINQSDLIAYLNPRVASVAQYTLRDDPAQAGFNTGLRFKNGKAKSALAAYQLPIWIVKTHSGHGKIFGQVRAATESVSVEVQHRSSSKKRFVTVAELQTNASGYFLHRFPRIGGEWRLKRGTHYSRIAKA